MSAPDIKQGKNTIIFELKPEWETILDIDFTKLQNQTIIDGNNTINGTTFYAKNTAAASIFTIENGTGLRINPNISTDDYNLDTAPRLWLDLMNLPNIKLDKIIRARIQIQMAGTPSIAWEGLTFGYNKKTTTPDDMQAAVWIYDSVNGYFCGTYNGSAAPTWQPDKLTYLQLTTQNIIEAWITQQKTIFKWGQTPNDAWPDYPEIVAVNTLPSPLKLTGNTNYGLHISAFRNWSTGTSTWTEVQIKKLQILIKDANGELQFQ